VHPTEVLATEVQPTAVIPTGGEAQVPPTMAMPAGGQVPPTAVYPSLDAHGQPLGAAPAYPTPGQGQQPYPGQPQQLGQAQYPSPAPYPGQAQQYPGQPQQYPGQPAPSAQAAAYGQPAPEAPQYGAPYGPPQPDQQQSYLSGYAAAPPGYGPGYPNQLPPQPVKKKRGKGLLIGLLAGLVVVALIAGGFAWWVSTRPKPSDAVRAYLTAVQGGNATVALTFASTQPTNKSWLTDTKLKAAQAAGGLSDIVVAATDEPTVTATYKVAGKAVTTSFRTVKDSQGLWKIQNVTSEISLANLPTGLDVKLNGDDLPKQSTILVMPGTYEFASTNKYVGLGDSSKVVITDTRGAFGSVNLKPTLTTEGAAATLAAAKKSFDDCIAQKTVQPPNCPNWLNVRANQVIDDSTVVWTVTDDPWSGVTPALDPADARQADADVTFNTHLKLKLKQDGRSGTVEQDNTFHATVKIKLSDLSVTWRS
ncbi:MAG: hypothetical protein WAV45_11670, partial [Propionibacteriaceae bacterium]